MTRNEDASEAVTAQGFAVAPQALDPGTVSRLIDALEEAEHHPGTRRREDVYAIRDLLRAVPAVQALARSAAVRGLVEPILGRKCFAVRGILFDKTPDANWKVVWHQDLTIAVRARRNAEGFGPWSVKAGVPHVQPPVDLLERMLTVRLHLDDCTAENGPLRVIPGSHHIGRLGAADIARLRAQTATVCPVPSGGALLMRPLLLHASSASESPRHRRIVHLEYATDELPNGLEWHDRIEHADA